MPNTIKTISLTADDKCYLNKLLAQSTLEVRIYQRARILLLKSEGVLYAKPSGNDQPGHARVPVHMLGLVIAPA